MVDDKCSVIISFSAEIGKTVEENVVRCARLMAQRREILEIGAVFAALEGDGLKRQRVTAGEDFDLDESVVNDGNRSYVGEIYSLFR